MKQNRKMIFIDDIVLNNIRIIMYQKIVKNRTTNQKKCIQFTKRFLQIGEGRGEINKINAFADFRQLDYFRNQNQQNYNYCNIHIKILVMLLIGLLFFCIHIANSLIFRPAKYFNHHQNKYVHTQNIQPQNKQPQITNNLYNVLQKKRQQLIRQQKYPLYTYVPSQYPTRYYDHNKINNKWYRNGIQIPSINSAQYPILDQQIVQQATDADRVNTKYNEQQNFRQNYVHETDNMMKLIKDESTKYKQLSNYRKNILTKKINQINPQDLQNDATHDQQFQTQQQASYDQQFQTQGQQSEFPIKVYPTHFKAKGHPVKIIKSTDNGIQYVHLVPTKQENQDQEQESAEQMGQEQVQSQESNIYNQGQDDSNQYQQVEETQQNYYTQLRNRYGPHIKYKLLRESYKPRENLYSVIEADQSQQNQQQVATQQQDQKQQKQEQQDQQQQKQPQESQERNFLLKNLIQRARKIHVRQNQKNMLQNKPKQIQQDEQEQQEQGQQEQKEKKQQEQQEQKEQEQQDNNPQQIKQQQQKEQSEEQEQKDSQLHQQQIKNQTEQQTQQKQVENQEQQQDNQEQNNQQSTEQENKSEEQTKQLDPQIQKIKNIEKEKEKIKNIKVLTTKKILNTTKNNVVSSLKKDVLVQNIKQNQIKKIQQNLLINEVVHKNKANQKIKRQQIKNENFTNKYKENLKSIVTQKLQNKEELQNQQKWRVKKQIQNLIRLQQQYNKTIREELQKKKQIEKQLLQITILENKLKQKENIALEAQEKIKKSTAQEIIDDTEKQIRQIQKLENLANQKENLIKQNLEKINNQYKERLASYQKDLKTRRAKFLANLQESLRDFQIDQQDDMIKFFKNIQKDKRPMEDDIRLIVKRHQDQQRSIKQKLEDKQKALSLRMAAQDVTAKTQNTILKRTMVKTKEDLQEQKQKLWKYYAEDKNELLQKLDRKNIKQKITEMVKDKLN